MIGQNRITLADMWLFIGVCLIIILISTDGVYRSSTPVRILPVGGSIAAWVIGALAFWLKLRGLSHILIGLFVVAVGLALECYKSARDAALSAAIANLQIYLDRES